ncbi:MAG: heme o synthase, partial [Sulfolobaceae archaeon]
MSILTSKIYYYIKLTKPNIIWLLDLAALGGSFLDYKGGIDIIKLIGVLIGGALASGGSMSINSGLEVSRDAVMLRTSKRPTVRGIISPRSAIIFGILLLAAGGLISLMLANFLTFLFVILGAFIYIIIYTIWLKPRSVWNIVIGGLAGSAAAWAGYASQHETLSLSAILLGLLIFMWTPGHFWALALRYKEDYERAGIPMLPVVINNERKSALYILVSNILMVPFAILLSLFVNIYFVIYTLIFSVILVY